MDIEKDLAPWGKSGTVFYKVLRTRLVQTQATGKLKRVFWTPIACATWKLRVGQWSEPVESLSMCQSGWHAYTTLLDAWSNHSHVLIDQEAMLYECAIDSPHFTSFVANKVVGRRIRLLRGFTGEFQLPSVHTQVCMIVFSEGLKEL